MNTDESQLRLFDQALGELAVKHPSLYFEDRCNPKHLKRYNEPDRPCKLCKLEFARFQAWRPILERVVLKAIPYKRGAVNEMVTFRRLVAWASNPKRLGEILVEKGVY